MGRVSSIKRKPIYPVWSDVCEHKYGISLSKAFSEWQGGLDSSLEAMRRAIVNAEPHLSIAGRKQLRSQYGARLRERKRDFADLIVKDYYYTTGKRWPLADHPVREVIPFELWLDLKYIPEQNKARGWSGLEDRYITYVEILVSAKFQYNRDYSRVAIRNYWFHLNKTQSQIIRRLHQAVLQNDGEGLLAKRFLYELGLKTTDISDYFRDQPNWRALVVKNGPGQYRLNAYGLGF
jgi:hypothetical protein